MEYDNDFTLTCIFKSEKCLYYFCSLSFKNFKQLKIYTGS